MVVGHPIAAAVTEGLVDLAARRNRDRSLDPAAAKNFALYGEGRAPSALGVQFEPLPSFGACLDNSRGRAIRVRALDTWRDDARGRGLLAG